MRNILFLSLLLLLPLTLRAQKSTKVNFEYKYFVPMNVSLEEAKIIALQRAKVEAIASEFGTLISQNNYTSIVNSDDTQSTNFQAIGDSEVKGEWIEDIDEPTYKVSYIDNQLVIDVKVKGYIREIEYAATRFDTQVLKNGTDSKYSSNAFVNGDDIYLSFRSPENGYLSVYLLDGEDAYCLLPYKNSSETFTPIKRSTKYIFFSEKEKSNAGEVVDEYTLSTQSSIEYNQLYVIFSPNIIHRANDNDTAEDIPRALSLSDFHKWLTRNRKQDKDMQVEITNIKISKN
ncbi:MAG: DUF4384 domain-containing protein [Rikenellaceae bacterium]